MISYNVGVRPIYQHLDPIVDLLIEHGNKLSELYRWGENRTGFFCNLLYPIDFDLIERAFDIPDYLILSRTTDTIECNKSWASIAGNMQRFLQAR